MHSKDTLTNPLENKHVRLSVRLTAIVVVVVLIEVVTGYALFWTHAHGLGALHELVIMAKGRWRTQPDAPPSAGPVTTWHSAPLPFYRPDASFGFAANEGRQTVTITKDNLRHRFVTTILPEGNGRATSHTQSPGHPEQIIGVFGDSWVFGWGNADETTFPFLLQSRFPNDLIRNYAFNGWCNTQALIKLKSIAQQGDELNVVVMAYADFYDERNVAAPSRLRGYTKSLLTRDYMPNAPGYGHPRARLTHGRLIIDVVPLFCEDNGLCDQSNPSESTQHKVSLAILTEARRVFPRARYLLAYLHGPDESSVVAGAPALGYEVVDLRPKTPLEWDDFSPLDDHPGPKAQVAYADKLFPVLAAPPSNSSDVLKSTLIGVR